MNKNYEEEYSLLEIAKYNLKKWPILLICALLFGLLAGAYGYKNTEPSVIYYEELQQVNGAYFISDYNDSSITERLYDTQQLAISHGAYEIFKENTGYEMTYKEYWQMFGYSNYLVTSIQNMYVAFPETYGNLTITTEEEAILVMQQLMDAQMMVYDAYLGEGAVEILSLPYTSSYTQASSDTATTPKDLLIATAKGGIAGIFLGVLLGIIAVSAAYLIGTVAKAAKEIEQKLKAPAIAFVHKDDRDEEFKKVNLFLEQTLGATETICYIPLEEKTADGGYDIAKSFARMNQKTLYINLSSAAEEEGTSLSDYLFGKCEQGEITVTTTADGVDVINRNPAAEGGKELLSSRLLKDYIMRTKEIYERVVVDAPEVASSSDAYGIASCCDRVLFGCKRRHVTGTDLYEISNTLDNNGITLNGVVVYGN